MDQNPCQDQDNEHKRVSQGVFPAKSKPREQEGPGGGGEEINSGKAAYAVLMRPRPRFTEDVRVITEHIEYLL